LSSNSVSISSAVDSVMIGLGWCSSISC
jgi:hypothetical protein